MDYADRLELLEQQFNEGATNAGVPVSRVPGGRYVARVAEAVIVENESNGRLQVDWEFRILTGEHKGKAILDCDSLETSEGFCQVLAKLLRLGYKGHEVRHSVLPGILSEIVEQGEPLLVVWMRGATRRYCHIRKVLPSQFARTTDDFLPKAGTTEFAVGAAVEWMEYGERMSGRIVEVRDETFVVVQVDDEKRKIEIDRYVLTPLRT